VLDATQDLAADVAETAQEFGRGRTDEDEARARLELASERADDLRERAEQLPAADRARAQLVSLNEQISRTATTVARELSAGRAASQEEIEQQIAQLRDEARKTVDAVSKQLDRQAQERIREALDRIGVRPSG
jgi:CHASE3 domain sensor protein